MKIWPITPIRDIHLHYTWYLLTSSTQILLNCIVFYVQSNILNCRHHTYPISFQLQIKLINDKIQFSVGKCEYQRNCNIPVNITMMVPFNSIECIIWVHSRRKRRVIIYEELSPRYVKCVRVVSFHKRLRLGCALISDHPTYIFQQSPTVYLFFLFIFIFGDKQNICWSNFLHFSVFLFLQRML